MNFGSGGQANRFAIERLSKGQYELWDAFVDTCPNGFIYHRVVWRELIKELFGHESFYLYARSDDGVIIGVLPLIRLKSLLFGDFLISLPYVNYGGAIATTVAIEEALMKAAVTLAQELGVDHIEFRDNRLHRDWPVRTDKVAMELQLPGAAEDLWSSLSSKVRAQIKRPTKEGVTTVSGGTELLSDFYRVFSRNMRDLGTPVYPRQLFALILHTFPRQAKIIVLKLQDKPVAAGFLLGFRGRLEIPWASSIGEFNRLGVNMLLYWESLKAAIDNGYEVFDFGRSTINSGTYRFKKQWGAQQKQIYWHYWLREKSAIPQLTPSNPKYKAAIWAWRHLPLVLSNWIGPKIVRNLP